LAAASARRNVTVIVQFAALGEAARAAVPAGLRKAMLAVALAGRNVTAIVQFAGFGKPLARRTVALSAIRTSRQHCAV
jgi:hypothetical protein